MEKDWETVGEVAKKYQEQILSIPGVVGMSTGILKEPGEARLCIRIYLSRPVERGHLENQKIPHEFEGVPVDIVVTGEVRALDDHS